MAEVLSAAALALAAGAFVLAAFAWTRAGGSRLLRAAPVRAAGTPPATGPEASAAPRAPALPVHATDPQVLLRLEALERRAAEESARRAREEPRPATPQAPARAEGADSPATRAARAGWRAFP
jgi:hypothetical protein